MIFEAFPACFILVSCRKPLFQTLRSPSKSLCTSEAKTVCLSSLVASKRSTPHREASKRKALKPIETRLERQRRLSVLAHDLVPSSKG